MHVSYGVREFVGEVRAFSTGVLKNLGSKNDSEGLIWFSDENHLSVEFSLQNYCLSFHIMDVPTEVFKATL